MDIQSTTKTIIRPYCSLSQIVRTEKQDEPLTMNYKNTIPFGDVNRLRFAFHELPRLKVYGPLVSAIDTVVVCLENMAYFGIYGVPLNGNIKNSYMYKGICNYKSNLNFRKRISGGSRASYLRGEKTRRGRIHY